jgi:hypothetical protein
MIITIHSNVFDGSLSNGELLANSMISAINEAVNGSNDWEIKYENVVIFGH